METAIVDGREVAFRRSGQGTPTIVLIAGGACDHTHYDTVFDSLGELRATIAYDRGGLGASEPLDGASDGLEWRTRELRTLLDASGAPGPYVLVGHSLGALIAQLFAVDHPDNVVAIVSLDGDDGVPPDLPPWPEFPPEIELEAMARLFRNKPASVRSPMPPLPAVVPAMLAESADRQAGLDRLARARRAGRVPDVPFVHVGATDHYFGPPELAPVDDATVRAKLVEKHERTAAAYPRGRFIEAAASGHYIQFDEPDLVIRVVAELLEAIARSP